MGRLFSNKIILFISAWFLCVVVALSLRLFVYERRIPVSKNAIPNEFPLLVLDRDGENKNISEKIVFYYHISKKDYSSYSFFVPSDSVRELQKQALQQRKSPGFSRGGFFTVSNRKDGTQLIYVEGNWGVFQKESGWYIAHDKSFTPLYYKNSSGSLVFTITVIAIEILFLLSCLYLIIFAGNHILKMLRECR